MVKKISYINYVLVKNLIIYGMLFLFYLYLEKLNSISRIRVYSVYILFGYNYYFVRSEFSRSDIV